MAPTKGTPPPQAARGNADPIAPPPGPEPGGTFAVGGTRAAYATERIDDRRGSLKVSKVSRGKVGSEFAFQKT